MNPSFVPSFRHFQNDIERYLRSVGKVEKNEYGQTVYRGYDATLSEMFRVYVEKQAFAPLVAEFRKWNWEWSYSDYLLDLTACLRRSRDWPLLKSLWTAVVAKRRTNYNKTKKARKAVPEKIPEALEEKTRKLLLESLFQLRDYASEFGKETEIEDYAAMTARVERKLNA
jgi:hypothetical protein